MLRVEESFYMPESLEPEQELAIAVIAQAFEDVQSFLALPSEVPSNKYASRNYHDIRLAGFDAAKFLLDREELEFWKTLGGINLDIAGIAKRRFPAINRLQTR